jgi:gas vesicle protein
MFLGDLLDMVNKKKREEERAKTAMKFAIGMGIAATIGLARGILYAPRSGKETRENLEKKAAEVLETVKAKVKDKAKALKNTTIHTARDVHDAVSHKIVAEKKKK